MSIRSRTVQKKLTWDWIAVTVSRDQILRRARERAVRPGIWSLIPVSIRSRTVQKKADAGRDCQNHLAKQNYQAHTRIRCWNKCNKMHNSNILTFGKMRRENDGGACMARAILIIQGTRCSTELNISGQNITTTTTTNNNSQVILKQITNRIGFLFCTSQPAQQFIDTTTGLYKATDKILRSSVNETV